MSAYFFIIFLLYYLFVGMMLLGWSSIKITKKDENVPSHPFASVVIAVRNEAEHIGRLLRCLAQQSITPDQFEIILVDDHSEDGTVEEIRKFIETNAIKISLLHSQIDPDEKISPKKKALIKGINTAKGEVIITTDGDCWFEKDWLKSMLSAFHNEKTMFVSGPVALIGTNSLLDNMQSIEFSSLIGTGAALIQYNYPLMCNGANLAFRKSAFDQVNGYDGNAGIASGDDVFLMQKIHAAFKDAVSFLKDHRAIVNTSPQSSVTKLIQQRKRWASKWNQYLLPFSWFLSVFLLVHYISFLAAMVAMVIFPPFVMEICMLILIKFILDYFLLKKVMDFCKLRIEFLVFILSELFYPFYALIIGILVHFGNYQWKGRVHNR